MFFCTKNIQSPEEISTDENTKKNIVNDIRLVSLIKKDIIIEIE